MKMLISFSYLKRYVLQYEKKLCYFLFIDAFLYIRHLSPGHTHFSMIVVCNNVICYFVFNYVWYFHSFDGQPFKFYFCVLTHGHVLKFDNYNRMGGVKVSVLTVSAVDHGFKLRSGQINFIELVFVASLLSMHH